MTRQPDDVTWRFAGPQASSYASRARAELGRWQATLGEGVETTRRVIALAPGVIADMRLVAGRPVIRIEVRQAAAPPPELELFPGCVVTPRSASEPNGRHPTDSQVILAPAQDETGSGWLAVLADATATGWADTPEPKGTFLDAQPEGFRDGGNIDWRGPRGERLTWYGPASRYWWDPHEPNSFPKQWVFHGGQVLLDATAYAAEQDDPDIAGGVAGGAFWDDADGVRWLHVIHLSGSTHRLVRYALTTAPLAIAGYEVVESTTLANSRTPWFFSEDGSKAVHMTDPDTGFWSGGAAPTFGVICRLAVSPSGSGEFSTTSHVMAGDSGSSDPRTAAIAFDFIGNDEAAALAVLDDVAMASLTFGGVNRLVSGSGTLAQLVAAGDATDAAALLAAEPSDDGVSAYVARRLFWADIRSNFAVFLHTAAAVTFDGGDRTRYVNTVEVVRAGQVVSANRLSVTSVPGVPDLNGLQPLVFHGSQPEVSPRLRMAAYYNTVGVPPVSSAWLVIGAAQNAYSPWQDGFIRSGWSSTDIHRWYARAPSAPFHREYGAADTRGHTHYVVGFSEGDHALLSIYTPVLRNTGSDGTGAPFDVESIDTAQAVNWMTFDTLPDRLATHDDPVFYPGFPLGLTPSAP